MADADNITVSGTSRPVAASADAPMVTIGRAEIARSGAATLEELLEQIPALGGQGVNASQASGYGAEFVDLRNLNFDRTVVLVDGKRFVLSGIRTDEAVDLNNIPVAFIDHVDVLRDGSHPEFGPDAVAGVVNVVLRESLDGVQVASYGGIAGAGDGGTGAMTLLAGRPLDAGQVSFSLGVFDRNAIPQDDRAWAGGPVTQVSPALAVGSPASAGGQVIGAGGLDDESLGGGRFRAFDAATDGYRSAASQFLQGGLQRVNASASVTEDLADGITANASLLFADRNTRTDAAPQAIGLAGTAKFPDGFVVPASNPDNPFGEAVALERTLVQAGSQLTTTSGPVWRVLAGLSGGIDAVPDGGWSVSIDHGESHNHYKTVGEIDLAAAAAQAGTADWFANALAPGLLRSLLYAGRSDSTYVQDVLEASAHAAPFDLPGGDARFSAGLDWRHEYGATSVDGLTASGDQAGADASPTQGAWQAGEAWAVLSLPLLTGRSWARVLQADLSARFTETDRYGAFPTGRAALRYGPADGVAFRASSGLARRPPAISEAFGGRTQTATPIADPCDAANGLLGNAVVVGNCRASGLAGNFRQLNPLVDVTSGGNPDLRPELSENESLGVVFKPRPEASLAIDWFHYRIRDAIDSLVDTDPNVITESCYATPGLANPLCGLITRARRGPDAGQLVNILALDGNVGTIKTSGIDCDAAYKRSLPRGIDLDIDWQTTWLLDWRLHNLGTAGFTQYAGSFPGLTDVGLYPRLRSRLEVTLERGAWSASWTGRYISGGTVLGSQGSGSSAPGVAYQDVAVGWHRGRYTLLAGIDNLGNIPPPFLLDGATNTDASTYDVVGRFVWARGLARF